MWAPSHSPRGGGTPRASNGQKCSGASSSGLLAAVGPRANAAAGFPVGRLLVVAALAELALEPPRARARGLQRAER